MVGRGLSCVGGDRVWVEVGGWWGGAWSCLGEGGRWLGEGWRCLGEAGRCFGGVGRDLGEVGGCFGEGGTGCWGGRDVFWGGRDVFWGGRDVWCGGRDVIVGGRGRVCGQTVSSWGRASLSNESPGSVVAWRADAQRSVCHYAYASRYLVVSP